MIDPSGRIFRLPAYAVAALVARKRELLARGVDVIDLGAGDADLPPPAVAVEALHEAARDPAMSRYAFQVGLPAFRDAVVRFMERRFGVSLDPAREILPLMGSKDGLAHLPLAMLDPGDGCVVPEPGYPAYLGGAVLAGARVEIVPLRPEHDFLVHLDRLPPGVLDGVRMVFLNYPNNPTGAVAPRDYLERTVALCRERGILLAYDNPYSELTYDGYRAPSILEIDGARDVAVEFHSLSKSFAMTGWRLGWVAGNPDALDALSKVKSYVDTGVFLAVQKAGAAVLDQAEALIPPLLRVFGARRDALVTALRESGWAARAPMAGMYQWLPLPDGIPSETFAMRALEDEGLALLAGSTFGAGGEGFVRLSFIVDPDRLREAARRMGRVMDRLQGAGSGA